MIRTCIPAISLNTITNSRCSGVHISVFSQEELCLKLRHETKMSRSQEKLNVRPTFLYIVCLSVASSYVFMWEGEEGGNALRLAAGLISSVPMTTQVWKGVVLMF